MVQQLLTINKFEIITILLFNNAFVISPMIILTVILSSNSSAFVFKFKTGPTSQRANYHLPLDEENDC